MKQRFRMGFSVFLALVVVASGLGGCVTSVPAGSVILVDVARSDKPRLPAPSQQEVQVPELVAGNTAFALDLYRALFDQEENLFCSPHSLSLALAMTYAGARETTERQMAEALHYTLPQAQLHPAFNALDQVLTGRSAGEDEAAFRLHITNAIWGGRDVPFLQSFLDTLAENYGAGLRLVDFEQVEESRRLINQWVEEQTEHRIQELLPAGSIDGETALVLTNAIYFQAAWMHPFAEDSTHNGTFTLLDGAQVTVPLMEQVAELGYAERPGVRAVELPYAGGDLSMVIVLPEAGTFLDFAQGLEADELAALLSEIRPAGVRLALPRFRFAAKFELKRALVELGMIDAFEGNADFSGIDGTEELFIDQVYHRAFVAVDEAGTEASAATAVVVARKGLPSAEQELRIDRPFLFMIRDIETGAILFFGHVLNPAL